MRLMQISDLHMTADGGALYGLDPVARLQAACLCIATGDLTDTGDTGAYEIVQACLDKLTMPYCALSGNHDHRERFQQIFSQTPADPHGFVQYSHDLLAQPRGTLLQKVQRTITTPLTAVPACLAGEL